MKKAELKLISELMKNSRRSDRELAKSIGTSQPTVTRIRNRLEEEGYIKEYTMLPDFAKLGYSILALTFVKLRKSISSEETENAREIAKTDLAKSNLFSGVVMLERGMGLGYDGVIMSFYKKYADYMKHMSKIREYPFIESSGVESFLISLHDEVRYRPLTLSFLANLLLKTEEKE